jgi:sensor histidine kinase YesM
MKLFAGFGRRHVLIALGFSLVVELAHLGTAWLGGPGPKASTFGTVGIWTVMYLVMGLIGLGCAVAADNLLGESASTAKRLVVAMLAAAIVNVVTVESLLYLWPALADMDRVIFVSAFHRIAYHFSLAASWALLLIGLYTMLQASRRATERLHQTQLAALAAERRVLEGDLRAMQGRVDPELLFDSLLEVDRCYAGEVEAGQEALDALIRFLRAALPGDAAATATVAGEQELAEAYLALVAQRADASPQVDISVAPEARALPMPAMLLLPLVRWALDGRSATLLQIRAQRRDAALEVSVRSNSVGSAASTEPNIAGVRERLARLFAGHASLDVTISADARHVRLQIPAS